MWSRVSKVMPHYREVGNLRRYHRSHPRHLRLLAKHRIPDLEVLHKHLLGFPALAALSAILTPIAQALSQLKTCDRTLEYP